MQKESKSGVASHFSSILRFTLLLILIAIITFFVVRWVQNRRDVKEAQKAASSSQRNKTKHDEGGRSDKDESNVDISKLPSGVAESDVNNDTSSNGVTHNSSQGVESPRSVPATGASFSVLIYTAGLMSATYVLSQLLLRKLATHAQR